MAKTPLVVAMDGEHFIYQQLWAVTRRQVDYATAQYTGSFNDHVVAMVFAFFTLEAYLNCVGDRLSLWKNERNCSFDDKMQKIIDKVQLSPDWGVRPYSVVRTLKKL